jgi:hypothetical protein
MGGFTGVYDRARQVVLGLAWSPDSQLLAISSQEANRKLVHVWQRGKYPTVPVTVGQPPSSSLNPLTNPQLDGVFGVGAWDLVEPRFEGDALVADVVCSTGEHTCDPTKRFVVRGGEDGNFDLVVAV